MISQLSSYFKAENPAQLGINYLPICRITSTKKTQYIICLKYYFMYQKPHRDDQIVRYLDCLISSRSIILHLKKPADESLVTGMEWEFCIGKGLLKPGSVTWLVFQTMGSSIDCHQLPQQKHQCYWKYFHSICKFQRATSYLSLLDTAVIPNVYTQLFFIIQSPPSFSHYRVAYVSPFSQG